MLDDLRIALRSLKKTPGFTMAVLATLALGIAANSAIFSVVHGVLLRPLPFHDAERLALLQTRIPALIQAPIPFSAPDVSEFARQSRAFDNVNAYNSTSFDLAAGGQAVRVKASRVTAGLLPMLGVSPQMGRTFTPEEDRNSVLVVVLSNALWQRQFGGDPNVVGTTVKLGLLPYTVIGVMPKGFQFPEPSMQGGEVPDLWVPMSWTAGELAAKGDNFDNSVIARLKPGLSWTQAREDSNRVMDAIRQTYQPEIPKDVKLFAEVSPLGDYIVKDSKTLLGVLMGAVGLLLLIACANVSNLLLIRSLGRQREVAVRLSMGATRARIVRQSLTECLVLGLSGGALGLLLAQSSLDLLIRFAPPDLPRLAEVQIDPTVLLFTFALSILATLAFGIAPSISASHGGLMTVLRAGSSGSMGSRGRTRLGNWFVAAQVALAVVLMVSAGLLMRTFLTLKSADPGFRTEHVTTASLALPHIRYEKPADVAAFYRRLLESVSTQPGIESVGLGTSLPMAGHWLRTFSVDGQTAAPSGRDPVCAHNVVTAGYFQSLGIAVKQGRQFGLEDRPGNEGAVIISESLAKRWFTGGDALGKRLKWGVRSSTDAWLKIVGIVADVKNRGLDQEPEPQTYTFWRQDEAFSPDRTIRVAIRTRGDSVQGGVMLSQAVRQLDPEIAVAELRTLDQLVSDQLQSRRFNMFLFGVFALAATLLAGIGVFGVMAHLVAQRTQEIGVRKALGAQSQDVLRLVFRRGLILVAAGLAVGLVAAVAAARLMQNLVYGVKPTDPLTLVSVCAVLLASSLAACAIPAWRALRVDPMRALRWE